MPNRARPSSRTCLALLLLSAPAATMHAAEPARVGEPYAMAGKRLVFSTWIHVRPGDVGWKDDTGDFVNADEGAKLGPFDATWSPADHMPWGIRIRAHPPAEVRPWVIPTIHPWEVGGDIYIRSILYEDNRYRAWGTCRAGGCYFESKDAIKWTRPELGLVEFEGGKANNLVPSLPEGDVFIDPTATDERYKCIWVEENRLTGVRLADLKRRRTGQVTTRSDWISPSRMDRKIELTGRPLRHTTLF